MKTIHPSSIALDAPTSSIDRQGVLARTLELIEERREHRHEATREIARENRISALNTPGPDDPRLRVISETHRRLQGALLTPSDRRAVIDYGVGLGLPRFDTNLLIAMVQDRIRRGEHCASIELAETCRLFDERDAEPRTGDLDLALRLMVAAVGGLGLALIAMQWLLA